ncbi:MAG: choline ABC transporter ATP-binding protein [Candidatus Magnetomorum sp.]|nr:choline ABC transporter ATP-binding protein [Candidatus Magnetomorum sp.]
MTAIRFENVDVIFGPSPDHAIEMINQGHGKDDIFSKTQNIVAVHDASFSIETGEICVLMGLSGSGKSTLLRCLNGLVKATRGNVFVRHGLKDINVATCDRKELHLLRTECISMVFQQFALMPWRTIRENVSYGLEVAGVSKKERGQIVEEKLSMVQLSEWADQYPSDLSGGMQQRVGLARALATDAEILLMDEPFSALDPLIRDHLQDELLHLQSNLKKTIVFVSHDLDEALKLGSRIAIMESGNLVQVGTPEDIVSQPANEYVKKFVASMNPLKALRCAALMRFVEELPSVNGSSIKALDKDKRCLCHLSEKGDLQQITTDGSPLETISFQEDMDINTIPRHTIVLAGRNTPMRVAVEMNYATGLPMPIVDHENHLLGVVGAQEIFRGILA